MQPNEMPPIPPRPEVPGVDEPQNQSSSGAQQLLGYDATGQPLYGTPALETQPQEFGSAFQNQSTDQPAPVRSILAPRLVDINPSAIRQDTNPEDMETRHVSSARDFPSLNLNNSEYVLAVTRRHPIGLAIPLIGGVALICIILVAIFSYPMIVGHFGSSSSAPSAAIVALVGLVIVAIVAAITYVAVWVFRANQLFLTNESVVENIQTSLFTKREQTLSLGNVEDVSFTQVGVLQTLFNYGSIRLTTEGEETEYQLDYVRSPRQQAAQFTNAVENFKNGRQVTS